MKGYSKLSLIVPSLFLLGVVQFFVLFHPVEKVVMPSAVTLDRDRYMVLSERPCTSDSISVSLKTVYYMERPGK